MRYNIILVLSLTLLISCKEKDTAGVNPKADAVQGTFDLKEFTLTPIDGSSIQKAVKNIHSLANSATKIMISIDCHKSTFWQKIFAMIPGDILHPHQFDLEEYKNHLTSRGLTIISEKKLKSEFFFDHWMLIAKKS